MKRSFSFVAYSVRWCACMGIIRAGPLATCYCPSHAIHLALYLKPAAQSLLHVAVIAVLFFSPIHPQARLKCPYTRG